MIVVEIFFAHAFFSTLNAFCMSQSIVVEPDHLRFQLDVTSRAAKTIQFELSPSVSIALNRFAFMLGQSALVALK